MREEFNLLLIRMNANYQRRWGQGKRHVHVWLKLGFNTLPHLLSFLHYHFNYGALNFTILILKALFHSESSHPFAPIFTQQELSCLMTQMVNFVHYECPLPFVLVFQTMEAIWLRNNAFMIWFTIWFRFDSFLVCILGVLTPYLFERFYGDNDSLTK